MCKGVIERYLVKLLNQTLYHTFASVDAIRVVAGILYESLTTTPSLEPLHCIDGRHEQHFDMRFF